MFGDNHISMSVYFVSEREREVFCFSLLVMLLLLGR